VLEDFLLVGEISSKDAKFGTEIPMLRKFKGKAVIISSVGNQQLSVGTLSVTENCYFLPSLTTTPLLLTALEQREIPRHPP